EGGLGSAASRSPAAAGGHTPAEPSYPLVPRVDPVAGIDSAATTRRHSLPVASAAGLGAAPDAYRSAAHGYPAGQMPAVSDPYGSLPAGRPAPLTNSVPASYQLPAVSYPGAEAADRPAGPDSATASYSVPSHAGSYS